MQKVHLHKTVSFQILPTWLDSCLWWVFPTSTLFASHLVLKNKLNLSALECIFFWNYTSCPWRVNLKHTVQSPTIPPQINSASGQTKANPLMDQWAWICWCSSMRYSSNFSLEETMTPPSPPKPWHLALCLRFWQGIFYEIDSKNESCEKKKLHCSMHPLDIPDDSKFHGLITFGNPSIYGEGLKIHIWTGPMAESKGGTGALRWELCYKIGVTLNFCSFARLLQRLCNHGMSAC